MVWYIFFHSVVGKKNKLVIRHGYRSKNAVNKAYFKTEEEAKKYLEDIYSGKVVAVSEATHIKRRDMHK